jgi:NADPH-dependent 2,4-dienoyl-CoA reductase/sulfur reductase-like enzyme/peroxiredoxin family protein/TusA-related sulfurtransferase/rhodanese-related sulfurtransferase
MKYVIVGGVAGGAALAARLRRNDEFAQIIIFEKGEYISYANCGLPYYVGEAIKDRDKLFLENPETFKENLNIDVKIIHEVISINKEEKTVKVQNLKNSDVFTETYDKLILSPGATPIIPPISGIDSNKVFTLRNVPDADKLKNFIDTNKPTSGIVIGAGFIGMEAAENIYDRGINVTIVEMANQVMMPLDYEMASIVHEHLKYKNIALYLSDGVKEIKDLGSRLEVRLQSGRKLYTDMIVLSIGVKPLTVLAENAGLEVDRGIVVNNKMETSFKDIYALGDAAQLNHGVNGVSTIVPLAGPAGKQARILADNLVYGSEKEYKGAIGTSIAKIFDLTVATTGLPEKSYTNSQVKSVIVNGSSHAGYYPGAMQLFLKLVFSEDGKIFGAQGVGYDGVDKRIEMISCVLRVGGDVSSLTEIEHAYAPPYSSSKDPVNILGFTAENLLLNRSTHTTWKDLQDKIKNGIVLLDVRTGDERLLHSIDNALCIEKENIRKELETNGKLATLDKNSEIVILCSGGLRAYLSERILKQYGFTNISILSGGLNIYFSAIKDQNNIIEFSNTVPHRENTALYEISRNVVDIDACGLQCPGPILKLKTEIEKVNSGEQIRVTASDPGFYKDVASWCNMTGNKIIGVEQKNGKVVAIIEKYFEDKKDKGFNVSSKGDEVTIVCFSDDMDKALASMVIGNGALASGKKVTIFFTFWGLGIIKKHKKPRVNKSFMGKMFSMMLPDHLGKLGLSKMNMGGLGSFMMKGIMNKLKIDSMQTMQQTLIDQGATFIACQMSMDVMGVKKEELIDEAQIGGVANYLEAATSAGINLFI